MSREDQELEKGKCEEEDEEEEEERRSQGLWAEPKPPTAALSITPFVFTPTFLLLRLSTLTTRALDVPSYILLSLSLLLSNMTFLTLHASILLPPHPDVHGGVK